jgi:hypothetical protein
MQVLSPKKHEHETQICPSKFPNYFTPNIYLPQFFALETPIVFHHFP